MNRRFLVPALFVFMLSTSSSVLSAEEELPMSVLVALGEYEQVRIRLKEQDTTELQKFYYEGLILHRQGKYVEAVALFRKALVARPEQVLVRRALVKSLLALEDFEAAEYHLELLLETDHDELHRLEYKVSQRRIMAEKPYGFSGSFAIVPSSNINHGTTNSIFSTGLGDFIIAESGKEKSGIGITASVSAFRRFQLETGDMFTFSGSISGLKYLNEDYDRYSLKIWTDYRHPIENGFWQISPKYTLDYMSGEKSFSSVGLGFKLQNQTSDADVWTYALAGYYGDYFLADYRDGIYWNGSVSMRRRLNPTLSISGKFEIGAGNSEAEHLQYHVYGASVEVSKSWLSGWRTSIGAKLDYKHFVGDFTAVDYPREDYGRTLQLSVMNSNFEIGGASPKLGCSYRAADSNIAFYEYEARECSIRFTRRF